LNEKLSLRVFNRNGLLCEAHHRIFILFEERREFVGQIDDVVRIQVGALKVLAVVENVATTEELLIKEHYHTVVSVAHDGSTQTEGDIFSLGRIHIDHSVSHIVIIHRLRRVGLTPEGEILLVKEGWVQEFEFTTLKLYCLEFVSQLQQMLV
jgi:hypothetical protein